MLFGNAIGGRYGSIEPKSGKSYTQLEYEYASKQKKPLFAVVIKQDYLESRVKELGSGVMEKENPQKLDKFRTLVKKNMVEFWGDPRDIQLSIIRKLSEFDKNESLKGWIPGGEHINSAALAEEIGRLSKENSELREQLTLLRQSATPMPEINVNAEIFHKAYEWYKLKRKRGGMYEPMDLGPPVHLMSRLGYVLHVTVSNSGDLAADLNVEVGSKDAIVEPKDVENFNKKDDGRPIVTLSLSRESGWASANYEFIGGGYSDWLFKGNVYSLKPGQNFQFEIPLTPVINSELTNNTEIEVKVFPSTGRPITKIFWLKDIGKENDDE